MAQVSPAHSFVHAHRLKQTPIGRYVLQLFMVPGSPVLGEPRLYLWDGVVRGRKRQRKKDEKRRGIYGLPFAVIPKRNPRDQPVADVLAQLLAYRFK